MIQGFSWDGTPCAAFFLQLHGCQNSIRIAMAVIPTRLVPGTLLAATFGCIGLETGLLMSALLPSRAAIPIKGF
jgi:hypothetical protein